MARTKTAENKKKPRVIARPANRTRRPPERFSVRQRTGSQVYECGVRTELAVAIGLAEAAYRAERRETWVWSIRTGKTLHTVGGVTV